MFVGLFLISLVVLVYFMYAMNSHANEARRFDEAVRDFTVNEIDEMYE